MSDTGRKARGGVAMLRTRRNMQMAGDAPCEDCMDLVAASPRVEPHVKLKPVPVEQAELWAFRCVTCDSDWICGRLGWARLVTA